MAAAASTEPRDVSDMALGPRVAAWVREFSAGPLTKEEFDKYNEDGWVIKKGVVPAELLEGAKAAVAESVDEIAQRLLEGGHITDACASVPFERRMIEIEKQLPHASVLMHKTGVLKDGIASLWGCKPLLDIAQQLLGPSIGGMPVWNLRVKTPGQEQATVPWHQDCAYLDPSGHDALQVTAWIPLVPARKENGCMQVLHRGHRSGEEAKHTCCVGGTWYVEMAEGEAERLGCRPDRDIVTCECDPGDILLMNNLIPHRSLPNTSDGIRWSLDLRWQRPDLPNGFYGLKDNIVMRKPDDPGFTPDWKEWAGVDRTKLSEEAVAADAATTSRLDGALAEEGKDDDAGAVDTSIVGPWMGRWEIVNHNRHTAKFTPASAETSWH